MCLIRTRCAAYRGFHIHPTHLALVPISSLSNPCLKNRWTWHLQRENADRQPPLPIYKVQHTLYMHVADREFVMVLPTITAALDFFVRWIFSSRNSLRHWKGNYPARYPGRWTFLNSSKVPRSKVLNLGKRMPLYCYIDGSLRHLFQTDSTFGVARAEYVSRNRAVSFSSVL